uniref:Y+L amino acid transporter 2-like isoform X1 n=1 Tax=Myxine glutinosa TaxID=7769 RepID=UPI00358F7939
MANSEYNSLPVNDVVDDEVETAQIGIERLKKEHSFIHFICLVVFKAFSPGIFFSSAFIFQLSGSYGLATSIWCAGGLFSLLGTLCLTEVLNSTFDPRAQGHVHVEGLRTFIHLWLTLLMLEPAFQAAIALILSTYLLQAFFHHCSPCSIAVRITAIFIICFLTMLNSLFVTLGSKLQRFCNCFMILVLLSIAAAGIVKMSQGNISKLKNVFRGSAWEITPISLALCAAVFSYWGQTIPKHLIHETKHQKRKLPLAIVLSLSLVMVVYILDNTAYFIMLDKIVVTPGQTIQLNFADHSYGLGKWLGQAAVVICCFGSIISSMMTSSRLFVNGSIEGDLPDVFSMLHITWLTPVPALLLNCVITLVYFFADIVSLIYYIVFTYCLFMVLACVGLLYLRWAKLVVHWLFELPPTVPALCLIPSILLAILQLRYTWTTSLASAVLFLAGLAVYYLARVRSGQTPATILSLFDCMTMYSQLLGNCCEMKV